MCVAREKSSNEIFSCVMRVCRLGRESKKKRKKAAGKKRAKKSIKNKKAKRRV